MATVLVEATASDHAERRGSVSFSREVRPLLNAHCGGCHGADEKAREAELRLDTREGLLAPGVVVPGKPEESELYRRVASHDVDEVMPPPEENAALTAAQVELVRRWIDEGGVYEGHWAFVAPKRREVPASLDLWVGGEIDAWVLDRLKKEGLAPAPPAAPEQWLRRVTLDLTGLPPTLAELDAFLADSGDAAREAVVERLMSTRAYAEHMAVEWLDVARYADTFGRHEDADCVTWPYRDWVIAAFEKNLPYDEFIRLQTAGDLMPGATQEQRVATTFNRLALQSNEAGSDPEEFRIEQVADRVATNATAFLGLTLACARCHDHKFDPLTTREFYSFSAFFNNIDELGLFAVFTGGVPTPTTLLYSPEQQQRRERLVAELSELEAAREAGRRAAQGRYAEWLKTNSPPRQRRELGMAERVVGWFQKVAPPAVNPTPPEVHYRMEGIVEKTLVNESDAATPGELRFNAKTAEGRLGQALRFASDDNALMVRGVPELRRHEAFSFGLHVKPEEVSRRAVVVHRSRSGLDAASRGLELVLDEMRPSFALVHFSPGNEVRIRAKQAVPVGEWTHVACSYDGSSRAAGLKLYVNGQLADCDVVRDGLKKDIVYRDEWGDQDSKDGVDLSLAIGWRFNDAALTNAWVDEFVFHRREITAPEVQQMALLADDSADEDWFPWYLREVDEEWRAMTERITGLRSEENELSGEATELMVMEEWPGPRRRTHVLTRGQFDQPAEEVQPETPAVLPAFPEGAPRNRLGLAQWLTLPDHPLTSRVAVNRFWQQFFGRGLVPTTEDFGVQGRLPSHPELLDALAVGFVEGGWDVKALCRKIVLSNTYGQSSLPGDVALLEVDPENELLARGPRRRMSAEQVRDMVLATSGLLCVSKGGPSVKPYQPEGVWDDAGTQHIYVQDHGDKLYRRSLYTFWRRTLAPPSMTVFDAPTREFCLARREVTHTPLQALVLMNDVQFLEAARVMAEALVVRHPDDLAARVTEAFRRLTSQQPTPEQVESLVSYLKEEGMQLAVGGDLKALATVGEREPRAGLRETEVGATTLMVRLLFGFSETTTVP